MKEDDPDADDLNLASRYPCLPSLVAMQQMKNRLHLAYLGKRLMKWTAVATGKEERKIAQQIVIIYQNYEEAVADAFILLARVRYYYPLLNKMVIENLSKNAEVKVHTTTKNITGVRVLNFDVDDLDKRPYELLGIEKGGQIIVEAKKTWYELLKRMIHILDLRDSFESLDMAHKAATKKMNVLGKIIIPKTDASIRYIIAELEESAREEFFRLKKVIDIKSKIKRNKEKVVPESIEVAKRIVSFSDNVEAIVKSPEASIETIELLSETPEPLEATGSCQDMLTPVCDLCKQVVKPPMKLCENLCDVCRKQMQPPVDENKFKLEDVTQILEREITVITKVYSVKNKDGTIDKVHKFIQISKEYTASSCDILPDNEIEYADSSTNQISPARSISCEDCKDNREPDSKDGCIMSICSFEENSFETICEKLMNRSCMSNDPLVIQFRNAFQTGEADKADGTSKRPENQPLAIPSLSNQPAQTPEQKSGREAKKDDSMENDRKDKVLRNEKAPLCNVCFPTGESNKVGETNDAPNEHSQQFCPLKMVAVVIKLIDSLVSLNSIDNRKVIDTDSIKETDNDPLNQQAHDSSGSCDCRISSYFKLDEENMQNENTKHNNQRTSDPPQNESKKPCRVSGKLRHQSLSKLKIGIVRKQYSTYEDKKDDEIDLGEVEMFSITKKDISQDTTENKIKSNRKCVSELTIKVVRKPTCRLKVKKETSDIDSLNTISDDRHQIPLTEKELKITDILQSVISNKQSSHDVQCSCNTYSSLEEETEEISIGVETSTTKIHLKPPRNKISLSKNDSKSLSVSTAYSSMFELNSKQSSNEQFASCDCDLSEFNSNESISSPNNRCLWGPSKYLSEHLSVSGTNSQWFKVVTPSLSYNDVKELSVSGTNSQWFRVVTPSLSSNDVKELSVSGTNSQWFRVVTPSLSSNDVKELSVSGTNSQWFRVVTPSLSSNDVKDIFKTTTSAVQRHSVSVNTITKNGSQQCVITKKCKSFNLGE